MHAIVLIEKHPTDSVFRSNCARQKPKEFVSAVFEGYKGFEGQVISYLEVDGNLSARSIQPLVDMSSTGDRSLMYVASEINVTPEWIKDLTVQVGYDIGGLDQESVYSSIINEVLFGSLHSLTTFQGMLNKNFLFPNLSLSEDYVKAHNQMAALGEDVEDFFDMTIYQIRAFY
ncbi:MAG: hypothetical protein Q8K75_00195 [Chlamydiales bacterium]|nr:hypothetical protein [Chlamydiales bacterium]